MLPVWGPHIVRRLALQSTLRERRSVNDNMFVFSCKCVLNHRAVSLQYLRNPLYLPLALNSLLDLMLLWFMFFFILPSQFIFCSAQVYLSSLRQRIGICFKTISFHSEGVLSSNLSVFKCLHAQSASRAMERMSL